MSSTWHGILLSRLVSHMDDTRSYISDTYINDINENITLSTSMLLGRAPALHVILLLVIDNVLGHDAPAIPLSLHCQYNLNI